MNYHHKLNDKNIPFLARREALYQHRPDLVEEVIRKHRRRNLAALFIIPGGVLVALVACIVADLYRLGYLP